MRAPSSRARIGAIGAGWWGTYAHLRDAIRVRFDGGAVGTLASRSSGELGVRVVELLEAAYRSVAERRIVEVGEL